MVNNYFKCQVAICSRMKNSSIQFTKFFVITLLIALLKYLNVSSGIVKTAADPAIKCLRITESLLIPAKICFKVMSE